MSPWLTFVIGVILGLLIGWIIDWWYRRRDTAASLEPVETRAAPPWTAPQVEAPIAPPVVPAVEVSGGQVEAAPAVDVTTVEPPSEPLPPADVIPPIPAELPEVALPAVAVEAPPLPEVQAPELIVEAPELPEVKVPELAVEAPVVDEIHLPKVNAELPELPEIDLPVADAGLPTAKVDLAAPVEQIDWPAIGGLPEAPAAVEEAPAVAHVADEVPTTVEQLPAEAVEALVPNLVDSDLPAMPVRALEARDRLIVIEGIGPVYEKKLNAAGINTFRQLAEAGEDQLREIIQPQSWQRVVFAEWIEQARLIMDGKNEELKALQERLFSRKKS